MEYDIFFFIWTLKGIHFNYSFGQVLQIIFPIFYNTRELEEI